MSLFVLFISALIIFHFILLLLRVRQELFCLHKIEYRIHSGYQFDEFYISRMMKIIDALSVDAHAMYSVARIFAHIDRKKRVFRLYELNLHAVSYRNWLENV